MGRLWIAASLAACSSGNEDECTIADVFADADGDGFGADSTAARRCPGHTDVAAGGDCDDADPAVFPSAPPTCSNTSTDDDCDGAVDVQDLDGDADGLTPCGGDCDDTSDVVLPTATEMCNTIDDDCDGLVDGDDDTLYDAIQCGVCPDPADLGVFPITKITLNPCVLDPTIVSLCHREDPDFVNTHSKGDRLHRILYRSDQPLRDELLLYLPPGPGTNNDGLLDWMGHSGYRLISLGWTNENSAFVPDDLFFENLRNELTYGEDTSEHIDVGPADERVGRLTTLLVHLASDEPTMGWEQYLDETGIRWDRIVVSGWSEGGSQAGWMARDHLFDGVLLISAPKDVGGVVDPDIPVLPPAPWVDDPRTTPSCRHFGFYHRLEIDAVQEFDVLLLSWDVMGILPFGQIGVDADVIPPPYDGSRVLRTSMTDFNDGFGCTAHGAMAMDQCMHEDLAVPYTWLFCNVGVPTAECP